MAVFDAAKEKYELMEIDGRPVLFTNLRLDRDTVPEGLFCYDVRDSDNLDGSFAQIATFVGVNHWGTILCREPFQLDGAGGYYPEDWSFLGESMGALEFRQAGAAQLAAMLGQETSGQNMAME
ncbi:MAG: hypothetical protein NC548_29995 [Lachnospiraceae bacterium]|nr:hypothetical protein [Lachnospiraceae bacterium]